MRVPVYFSADLDRFKQASSKHVDRAEARAKAAEAALKKEFAQQEARQRQEFADKLYLKLSVNDEAFAFTGADVLQMIAGLEDKKVYETSYIGEKLVEQYFPRPEIYDIKFIWEKHRSEFSLKTRERKASFFKRRKIQKTDPSSAFRKTLDIAVEKAKVLNLIHLKKQSSYFYSVELTEQGQALIAKNDAGKSKPYVFNQKPDAKD